MSRTLITSAAEQDFTDALRWYAERSPRAAEEFDVEFDAILHLIDDDPHRFPFCDDRHRYCLMRRYPYQVIYREHGKDLAIIAVAHAKRKPGYWQNR